MCGIGGFSLNKDSRVNARQLAHELLSELEVRGTHASGFAYSDSGEFGIFKAAKTGSQLPLAELPRTAKTVILHTRFATQGPTSDNRNNHPVVSPKGNIALVHNGVISNDDDFRERWPDLPAVDSAVLPAIIESDGVMALKETSGYAAVAWLDAGDPTARDVLTIARLESSPVAYTWLYDGSFVWASTIRILMTALERVNLDYGYIFSLEEGNLLAIKHGVPIDFMSGLEMKPDWWASYRFGNATSGGHGTASATATTRPIGSSFGKMAESDEGVWDDDAPDDEKMSWEDDYRTRAGNVVFDPSEINVAMAFGPESNEPLPRGVWLRNPDSGDLEHTPFPDMETALATEDENLECSIDLKDENKGFFVTHWDGDMEYFTTMDEVENHLAWLANMTLPDAAPFPNSPNMTRWTNQVLDIGDITVRGGMQSWLDDMSRIDYYESPVMYNLDYIRDGLGALIELKEA